MIESHRMRLPVVLLGETATAWHVARTDDRRAEAWVPKSLTAIEDEKSDGTATLLITQALAQTRRLVAPRQAPKTYRGGERDAL